MQESLNAQEIPAKASMCVEDFQQTQEIETNIQQKGTHLVFYTDHCYFESNECPPLVNLPNI